MTSVTKKVHDTQRLGLLSKEHENNILAYGAKVCTPTASPPKRKLIPRSHKTKKTFCQDCTSSEMVRRRLCEKHEFKQIQQEEFGRNLGIGTLDKTEVGGSYEVKGWTCTMCDKEN